MADSLIIAGQVELMGASGGAGTPSLDPRCPGAIYQLGKGYDFGAPQPVTAIIGTLMIDGERPIGRRASNRTLTIPVMISAPSRLILVAARELLLSLVDQQDYTIAWLMENGQKMLFDCFRAQPSKPVYNVLMERQFTCQLTLTIPALPYGRSAVSLPLAFTGAGAGGFTTAYTAVALDNFTSASGTNWSQASASSPTGTAAYWNNPLTSIPAVYTSTLANLNLTGMTALSEWIGTALDPTQQATATGSTSDYGFLAVKYTLTDSSARTLTFGSTWHRSPSRDLSHPTWVQVSTAIPQGAAFTYSNVVGCVTQVTNHENAYVDSVDVFLDTLAATPPTTLQNTPPARGLCYELEGVIGTAAAPVSLWLGQTTSASAAITPTAPAALSGGYLTLPCTSAGSSAVTGTVFNMVNSTIFAKVAQVPQAGNGGTKATFRAQADVNNYFGWSITGGVLTFQLNQAGTLTSSSYGAYSGLGPYWRIRAGTPVFPMNELGWVNVGTGGNNSNGGKVNLNGAAVGGVNPQNGFNYDAGGTGTGLVKGTTTGDAIVVVIIGSGLSAPGVSDSKGNTYTSEVSNTALSGFTAVYIANNPATLSPAAGDNIYLTWGSNAFDSNTNFSASVWSAPGYYTIDTHAVATGTSTAPSAATGTMSIAGDMEMAFFMNISSLDTTAPPSGWSEAVPVSGSLSKVVDGSWNVHAYWKYATGTTSDTATAAYSSSIPWEAVVLSIKTNLGSGTVYFDNSFDGISWTNLYSHTHTLTTTQLQNMLAYFASSYTGTEYGPEPMLVGGINTI